MNDNDDLFRKFDTPQNKTSTKRASTILACFVVSIIGALIVCSCFYYFTNSKNDNNESQEVGISLSTPQVNNPNLEQVSLSNYSDTAVYAANKVLPSIVSIYVEYDVSYFGRTQTSSGQGSGVIISEDGYILTNNHVISSADSSSYYEVSSANSITVKLYGDETEYEAKIIGTDEKTDLAVLKIEKTGLTPAEFGDSSSVQVGEFVLAVGDPYGLEHSVTAGIISALNRNMTVDGVEYTVMQADCAINSGNSGGAFVNSHGQVIGVATLKLSGTGIEGVSFAIPINDTVSIYTELIQNGKIARPYIGFQGIALDEATAIRNGLTKGIYVDSVLADSPAEEAGLQAGDVIVEIDGQTVSTMDDVNEIKNSKKIGDEITLKVYRRSTEIEIKVTLGEE